MRTLRKYSKFILLLGLPFWLYACGGGSGGGSGGDGGTPLDTTFSGGTLDELKALSSSLNFKNLTITGGLSLPISSAETIAVDNLTLTSTGSIGYSYSTCEYVDAPGITINATGDVSLEGEIRLNGRSGTSVTSGASCNRCTGQNGGNISINASNIQIGARLLNYGGSGGTYRDSFGSSGCRGGNSGNLDINAASIDMTGAEVETHAGRGGAEGFGYGPSGTAGAVNLEASGLFKMNPGSIRSDSTFTLIADQSDIIGPITYATLTSMTMINGEGDVYFPTATVLAPVSGATVALDEPLEVRIQASDSGLGVREIDISGFGYSGTYSAADMVNGVLTIQIDTLDPGGSSLQATVRDNMLFETTASVSGLSVSYGAEQEPNDSPGTAQALTLPVAIEGSISPGDTGTCDPGIAPAVVDTNCFYHTAQDYYTFTVAENKDMIIELEFAGNGVATDLDIYLDYSSGGAGWWTSSVGDNASTLVYSETIPAYLFTLDTFTIAIQAWPSWTGSADYRLTIRPAP